MPRDVFLPPGVPEGAVAYYAQMFKKVSETPEWAEYVAKTSQRPLTTWRAPSSRPSSRPTKSGAEKIFEEQGWLVK